MEIHSTRTPVGTLRRNGTRQNQLALEILGASVGVVTSIQLEKDPLPDTTSVALNVDMFTHGLPLPIVPRAVRFLAEDRSAIIVAKVVAGLGLEARRRVL